MIILLSRDKLSYFQSYKNYFTAIYVFFLGFPIGALVKILFYTQPPIMVFGTQLLVTSGASIATIWGYVATRLYMYPEPLNLRRLISSPFRPIILVYAAYLVPMFLAVAIAWNGISIMTGPSNQVTYVFDGTTLPGASVGPLLLGMGVIIVAAFTSYPLAILSRRRALVKDRDVRAALRIIASVFGMISATLISGIGLSSFGYSLTGVTNLISVALIIVAVHAFRKPTFLKSFLGVVPSLQSSPTASHYDQMILIHDSGDEKYSPITKYLQDGIGQRELVIYFHDGDLARVTQGLTKQGVDVKKLTVKGALRIQPLASAYTTKGVLDDTPLEMVQALSNEAKALGNEGLRVILDYDDFSVRPFQKFVKHLTDPRWTNPDHHLHVLMAFNSTTFRGEEASLAELENKIRTLDLSESLDTFSKTVGVSHQEIAGRKLLLEFDPQGDIQQIFKSLLAETASNFERTVVFTRKDSPIYSLVQRQPAAKIFVLTSRVSYPKMENENLFLLPSYDTSLLLDALNKTIEAYAGSAFTIIVDNLSHFVFTLGAERTYALVRQALELMISDKITAIFSINSKAHDQKIMSTFENMFDIELVSEQGSTLPEIKKKIGISG